MSIVTTTTRIDTRKAFKDREADDWYVEPPEAVEALIRVERFWGSICDPCAGIGTIRDAFRRGPGIMVDSFDRVVRTSDVTQADFMDPGWDQIYRDTLLTGASPTNFVMNPPYGSGLAQRFAERALSFEPHKVCVLARLAFLETPGRAEFFRRTLLSRVWIFSDRISMPPGRLLVDGKVKRGGGAVAFAWFVWDAGATSGAPQIGFVRAYPDRNRRKT